MTTRQEGKSLIPCAEASGAVVFAAVLQGASASWGRARTEAAVLVQASFVLPVLIQVPGGRPQQVKALPAHWQGCKLRMLSFAWLVSAMRVRQCEAVLKVVLAQW